MKHSSNISSDHWEVSNLPRQPARVSTQKGPQLLSRHLSLVLGLQEETRPTPVVPVRGRDHGEGLQEGREAGGARCRVLRASGWRSCRPRGRGRLFERVMWKLRFRKRKRHKTESKGSGEASRQQEPLPVVCKGYRSGFKRREMGASLVAHWLRICCQHR